MQEMSQNPTGEVECYKTSMSAHILDVVAKYVEEPAVSYQMNPASV